MNFFHRAQPKYCLHAMLFDVLLTGVFKVDSLDAPSIFLGIDCLNSQERSCGSYGVMDLDVQFCSSARMVSTLYIISYSWC